MSDEPKKGNRCPDYIHDNNVARVESLMVEGYDLSRIFEIMVEEKRTESRATVYNWRNEVTRRWSSEELEMRPARKDLWRQRIEKLYLKTYQHAQDSAGMTKVMALGECTKIAKLAIALDGLAAPVVIRNEGAVDPLAMSPAERNAEINALLAKREEQMRKGGEGN